MKKPMRFLARLGVARCELLILGMAAKTYTLFELIVLFVLGAAIFLSAWHKTEDIEC